MYRIDTPTAQKDKFGAGKNGFTRGNPQTGTPATELDDDYFDMLQEELASVVEAAGVKLSKSKNDQLLTSLRALLLSRANPFADIKSDGNSAVAQALGNLGIKSAALKDIGEGANQVPDMSFFGGQSGDSGYIRIPGGRLIVYGTVSMSSNSTVVTLPLAFKNTQYRVIACDRGNGCLSLGVNGTTTGTITVYRPGKAYNSNGNLVDVTGNSAFSYIAVGDAP